MYSKAKTNRQAGYSIVELLIAMGTMVIITGAAFGLMHSSLKFATATFHMTDAEQSLRTAHELINRDLTTAGDGLKGLGTIQVPVGFVTNYLTQSPVVILGQPNYVNMAIVTSDDNVPGSTTVPQPSPSPAANVFDKSDRLTLLTQDTGFLPTVSLLAGTITSSGSNTNIVVPSAQTSRFRVGEIYAITTQNSAAFGVISTINAGTNTLTLTNGDVYGLNQTGAGTPIYSVSHDSLGGPVSTTLMRIQIIHYYLNSNKLLVRRVFGVSNAGYIDSVIAEHVLNVQFRYFTNLTDPNGFIQQPVRQLSTSTQQLAVRQVETTVTTETVKAINTANSNNNGRQTMASTTMTSVRNMQFRQALSP